MKRLGFVPIVLAASAVVLSMNLSTASASGTSPQPNDALVPAFTGPVFVIVGENTQLSQINVKNAPWMSAALQGTAAPAPAASTQNWASLTNYWATTHYSESNYVAMMSGQFTTCQQKDGTAANCHQDVDNLFNQLYQSQHTFTTWSESMPNACHLLNTGGDSTQNHYAAKHNPQLFFDNVEGDPVTAPPFPNSASNWVNVNTQGSQFCQGLVTPGDANIATGTTGPNDMSWFDNSVRLPAPDGSVPSFPVADFNLVVPNECEDGHSNCKPEGNPVTQFDDFLAREVPKIQDYVAAHNGLLIVTFDEGVTSSPKRAVKFGNGGNVAFLAWGPQVHPGTYNTVNPYTHYSLLRTLEDGFGLNGYLEGAASVEPITEIWNEGP